MTAEKILEQHTKGAITLEEANALLKENDCNGLQLDPFNNVITGQEFVDTVVSDDPEKVTGWGLMNYGVGTPTKIHVQNGKLDYDTEYYNGEAVLFIKGEKFRVNGDHIEVYKK